MYLIPKPQVCNMIEGVYTIEYDHKIVIDSSCDLEAYRYAVILQDELVNCAGYELTITKGQAKKMAIMLAMDKTMMEEEYHLEVNQKGIFITGGSNAGLLHGVTTLRQMIRQEGVTITYMEIKDYPSIANRGLYYDVTRGRIPTLDYLKKLADKMSFYKMNQLQLYIEHSFLFENLSEVWRDDTPLTAEDILELDVYCRERNIELVPSLSCFGHLYKVLRTKTYNHLCELPDAQDQPFGFVDRMEHHTLDVSNPDSLLFVKGLIEEYIPLFTSNHFNIGADETFDLGKGRSKALAQEKGSQRMYLDFVKELCEFIVSKGKRPMFWGDIICGFPEAIKELPKETICLNWGYSANESEESTQKLAEAGATQYTCPGVSGWDQFVNQIDVSYENTKRMCEYAIKYNAIGVLTTDWGDCGHINHPDFGVTGMIYGAAFSWNKEIPSSKEINKQISRIEFMDESETLVSVVANISKNWVFKWRDAVNYMESRNAAPTEEELSGTQAALDGLTKITTQLYHLIPKLEKEKRNLIKPYIVAIQGMELTQKVGVVLSAREYNTDLLIPIDALALAVELEEWFYNFKEVWRSVSRESELYRIQNVVYWYADFLRQII